MDRDHPSLNEKVHLPIRLRRLRKTPGLRALVRETELSPNDLVYPLFLRHGSGKTPIDSMPGIFQLSIEEAVQETYRASKLGIPAVLIFGIPAQKDPIGLENFSPDGIVQQGIMAIKRAVPEMIVISDVCLCEYTDHGHCGLINDGDLYQANLPRGYVLNDQTLEILGKVAVSHAVAGVDIIAPSGMMDGMVAALRFSMDAEGYETLPILSYAIKYASAFYGPFRDAAEGAPKFGDRASHQMDPYNVREALREARLDIKEGADMLMVKPALTYLDVILEINKNFPGIPLAAYNVSGEFAMIKAAAHNGWLDEVKVVLEILTSMKRAGADFIITYHAIEAAEWLS